MRASAKIGPNQPCPCGSGRKYKKCCRDKATWETLLRQPLGEQVSHLSARGKNLLFLNLLGDALQLDKLPRAKEWVDFKRAFTPEAVRRVFQAVEFVWPSGQDLKRVLLAESRSTSGLYVGMYDPRLIITGVTRHSLYADRILLVDPFMYAARVRDNYNPILHPEMHRSTALRWVSMWFSLWPWIEAGVVAFVRTPGDFYPDLEVESWRITEQRFKDNPELEELRKKGLSQDEAELLFEPYKRQMLLAIPDDALRDRVRRDRPDWSEEQVEKVIEYVQRQRDADPFFIEPLDIRGKTSELLQFSSGANYEMAKLTALHSRSFLMTDLPTRWREIEIDRKAAGIDPEAWSPFAKAFQALPFHYLNSVPLPAALALRQEGRLEPLRSFLRRVWNATAGDNPFDETKIPDLAAELEERIREAEVEWNKIDRELLRWFGTEFAAGTLALGPAIATGSAEWAAAAVAIAGAANLVATRKRRQEYELKYPGGFFVKLQEGRFSK